MPDVHVWPPRQIAQVAPSMPQAVFWLPSGWQVPLMSQQPRQDIAQDEASLRMVEGSPDFALAASFVALSPPSLSLIPLGTLDEPPSLEEFSRLDPSPFAAPPVDASG